VGILCSDNPLPMFGTSRPQKSCLPRRRFAPQGNLWSVALSPRSMVTSCVFIQAHGWKCHCNKGTGRCQWHSVECLWYCYIILLCVRKKHVDSIVCFVSFSVLPYVVMFATSSFGGNCNWLVAIYLSASEDGLKSVAVRYAWNWNVLVNTPEPSSCFSRFNLHFDWSSHSKATCSDVCLRQCKMFVSQNRPFVFINKMLTSNERSVIVLVLPTYIIIINYI